MDAQKLITKLQRELLRNPKKTAILVLVTLVAGYFWAPLVAGWLGDGEKKTASPTAQDNPLVVSPQATPVAAETGPTVQEFAWNELFDWMQQDPRMRSAELPPEGLDPFRAIVQETISESTADEEIVPDVPPPVEVTPQAAGLVLTGTVVVPGGGWAQINDEEYRQGETVRRDKSSAGDSTSQGGDRVSGGIEFTLSEIHNTYVVLVREGHEYRLEMDRPALPPGSQLDLAVGQRDSE